MQQSYTGGCRCGKVRYQLTAEIGEVVSCNCSRCQRLGLLLTFAPVENFRMLAGEDATSDYQFNKHIVHHRFCSTCGVQSFASGKGPDGREMVAVNVRCLDDIDLASLKIKRVDGRSR
jgi:hypothetical protein